MPSHAKTRKAKIRVLVADSSRIHTHLLSDALKREAAFEVISFDSDSQSLISAATGFDADVLVISSDLDDQHSRGFQVLHDLRARKPEVRAIVLMDTVKDEMILSAFRAGARGIFGKTQPVDELCRSIKCVHQGQIWANSREMSLAVEALANAPAIRSVNARALSLLSKREIQVVHCLAEGLGNREIANRLKLSQHTVKNHLFRIFDKLGVSSRIELMSMTMSQPGLASSPSDDTKKSTNRPGFSNELALLQKAADAGLPAAQMAMAQVYLARRSSPRDAIRAYTWYLVALERAAQAKTLLTNMLTPEQIEEAQENAKAKLLKPDAEISSDLELSQAGELEA
jgi:DNA-binding NarL/FixJ family response regulator